MELPAATWFVLWVTQRHVKVVVGRLGLPTDWGTFVGHWDVLPAQAWEGSQRPLGERGVRVRIGRPVSVSKESQRVSSPTPVCVG